MKHPKQGAQGTDKAVLRSLLSVRMQEFLPIHGYQLN